MPELAKAARDGKFNLCNADPNSDQGAQDPYETEEEWAVYLGSRDQNETLMEFPDMPQKMKITVEGKQRSWNYPRRKCKPDVEQPEWPLSESVPLFCFIDALGRKTHHISDRVTYDVSSLAHSKCII